MGMPMPGGWTMSMAWMRMPGQSWLAAAVAFAGMWAVMMIPMMLPSITPVLWRYRRASHDLAVGGAAYFGVWILIGLPVYAIGAALASIEMHQPGLARAVPLLTGLAVLIASVFQFTPWKQHRLECCRQPQLCHGAWRHGLRLGIDCIKCCANLTAVLLVLGVMDIAAMAAVTIAITAERVLPNSSHIARVTGSIGITAGLILMARAI